MKKTLFVLLSVLVLTSMLLSACGTPATATQAPATQAPATQAPAAKTVKKIAFLVSDLSVTFHQQQCAEAKKYAKATYGVDVYCFDGKSDSAVMV